MKNNSWKPFAITLIVVVILLGMFYLPRIKVGETTLRRVNILSEVQARDTEGNVIAEVKADEAEGIVEQKFDSAVTKVVTAIYVDSVPEGMTGIEDFAGSASPIMDHFYSALDHASSRPVRIAYYGDSYIEGDILTQDLREYLQGKYGGCGVGFVDIQSITAGFRQTVSAKNSGWTSHSSAATDKGKSYNKELMGVNGRYFISSNGTLELKGTKRIYASHLDTVPKATVYFTPGPGLKLQAAINGGEFTDLFANGGEAEFDEESHTVTDMHVTTSYNADSTEVYYDTTYTTREVQTSTGRQEQGKVVHKSLSGRINTFKMKVSGASSSRFYGVALDGTKGISLDNFAMRASTGYYIADIPMSTLKSFNSMRPYDLIIVHFGLNVANKKQKDYTFYTDKMEKSIAHLKEAFPNSAILVVSVGDRDEKGSDGKMHTMKGITELVSYQRKMASDQKVAFWNLYEAMGGDGSMAEMVNNKQGNRDYTHINFQGGKRIAKLLFDVLNNGKENYNQRK